MARTWDKKSRVHRDLILDDHYDYQRGNDVATLQRSINRRAEDYDLNAIKVDGVCGRSTIARGRQVARALGVHPPNPGLPKNTQRIVRNPALRTPRQHKQAKQWSRERDKREAGVKVHGDLAQGGTPRQRLKTVALAAADAHRAGRRRSFYSQPGAWTVKHAISGEPRGYRSDCSQFVTSVYHSAGLNDPNRESYHGGYTGTLARGKRIARGELQPGDLILYGAGPPYHHVEMYVGPGDRTIGHGSPPVDEGDIDMIANPHFYTYDLT